MEVGYCRSDLIKEVSEEDSYSSLEGVKDYLNNSSISIVSEANFHQLKQLTPEAIDFISNISSKLKEMILKEINIILDKKGKIGNLKKAKQMHGIPRENQSLCRSEKEAIAMFVNPLNTDTGGDDFIPE